MTAIQYFEIDSLLVERVCEYIMKRRQDFEPDDTPDWKDYIAKPENQIEAAKWRLQTRHALEAIQKFAIGPKQ